MRGEEWKYKGGEMKGFGTACILRAGREARAGMTLVEVLLAIVILGSALAALLSAASQAIGVVKQARNYETARTMLGMVEVEKPLRLEEEITVGEESGSFKDGPAGWTWKRRIEPASEEGEDDELMGGLYLVTTTVYWGSGSGRTSSEETVRYLYVPENIDGKRTLRPKGL